MFQAISKIIMLLMTLAIIALFTLAVTGSGYLALLMAGLTATLTHMGQGDTLAIRAVSALTALGLFTNIVLA